ncbi:uncharacterized protein LOC100185342 isoform X2 [Ciona intestinalis]
MQGTSDARQTMESQDELHGGVVRQRGNVMEQNNGSNETTPEPNKELSPTSSKGSSVVLILLLLMVGITWGIAATAYFGVVDYKVLVARSSSISTSDMTSCMSLIYPTNYPFVRRPLKTFGSLLIDIDESLYNLFIAKEQASYIDKRRSVAMVTPYNRITFSIKETEKVVTERGEPPVMSQDNQPSKEGETTNENMKTADKDERDNTLKQTEGKVKVKDTAQDPTKSKNSTPKKTKKPTTKTTDGTGSTAWTNTSNINATINNPLHRPTLPVPYTHDTTHLEDTVILLTTPHLPMNVSFLCIKPVLKIVPAPKKYQKSPEEDTNKDADRDDGKSVFNPFAPKDQEKHPEPLKEDHEENKMQKVVFNPFSPKYQVFEVTEEKPAESLFENSKVLVNPMSPKQQQSYEDITTQLPQGYDDHYVKITSNPMSPKSQQVKIEQIFSFSPFKSTQGTTPVDKYNTQPYQLSTSMGGYKIAANKVILNKEYHYTQPNVFKPIIHLLPLQKQYLKPGFNKMFNKYKQRVFQHTKVALNRGLIINPRPKPPSPPTLSIIPLNLHKDVATIIKTPINQRQAVTNIAKVSNPNILSIKRSSSLRKVDIKITNRTTVAVSPLGKITVQIKRTRRLNKRHLRTTVPSTLPLNIKKVKVFEMRSFLNRTVVLTVVPNKAGQKPMKIIRPVPLKPAIDKLNCFNVNVTVEAVVAEKGPGPREIVAIHPVNKGLEYNHGVLRNKNHFKLLYGANPVNKRLKNTCHACLFCRPTLSGQVLNKKPSISENPGVFEALSSLVSKISKSRLHLFGESSTNTEEGCATISDGVGSYARHVCGKLSKLFSFHIDDNMRNTVLITLAMILFYHALVLFIQLQIEARN